MQKLYKLEVRVVWWVILPRYLTCRSFSLLRSANWQIHQALHANYVIMFKFRKWDCLWSRDQFVIKLKLHINLNSYQNRPQTAVATLGDLWLKIILCKTVDKDRPDLEVLKINFVIYLFIFFVIILKNTFEGTTSFKTLSFSFNDSFLNNINCTNELSANPVLLSLYPKNKRIWKKKNYIQTVRKAFPSIHFTHAIIWQGWFELFYGEHTNGFQF